ncbi:MurR/RpiR family transcriptional regulator [Occultella gossypii]|uniref:MurR/RpiR family transcriptional regulator n=1 Tax=Occultella gossypii TaxID=2800820 RepID=A0ABS7S2U7_9MICO|nr:MurR/RpiR family transcriptional regulator [Occultella gossypii]MBZ2194669.1 MurR/RpiR family transcriptional regulator [Occultella gossypii]
MTNPPVLPDATVDRNDGCLARLRTSASRLTGARQRVAVKILENPWAARGLSISALASHVGASENAISRITQAIGYSGYREFMQELALDLGKNMGYQHVDPAAAIEDIAEGTAGVVRQVVKLEIDGMQDALANLDDSVLDEVVHTMVQARTILLLGTGTAAGLCQMLAYRFTSIGIAASWSSDPMVMLAEAHRTTTDDLVVLVSFSGYSRDTVFAGRHAREQGASVLAVTSDPQSAVAQIADTVLSIFSARLKNEAAQFSGRVAGLALLEAIATAVSWERGGTENASLAALGEAQTRLNTLPGDWESS